MALMIDLLDLKRLKKANEGLEPPILDDDFLNLHTPCFEITNVANLAYTMDLYHGASSNIQLRMEKFSDIYPPFRSYWMEWRCPENLNAGKKIGRFGVWCIITDKSDDAHWSVICALFIDARKPRNIGWFELKMFRDGHVEDPGRLHIRVDAAEDLLGTTRSSSRRNTEDPATEARSIRLQKIADAVVGMTDQQREQYLSVEMEKIETEYAGLQDAQRHAQESLDELSLQVAEVVGDAIRVGVLPPLLLAHSLLACKNVATETQGPSAQMRKANLKRRGHEGVRFKTLLIHPMGGSREEARRISIGDGMTAMHLVRGHPKTFTVARPLFGKHVGKYYWSPNVRGNKEAGVIVKDYQVQGATNEAPVE